LNSSYTFAFRQENTRFVSSFMRQFGVEKIALSKRGEKSDISRSYFTCYATLH